MRTRSTARAHRAHIVGRRRQIRTLRAIWRPIRLPHAPLPRSTAWILIAGLYSVGWLVPALAALLIATSPPEPVTSSRDAWSVFGSLVPSAGLVLVGLATLRLLATLTQTPAENIGAGSLRHLARTATPRTLASNAMIYLLALTAFWANGFLTTLLEAIPGVPDQRNYPWSPADDPGAAAMSIYDSMIGGAVEEFIVLAIPVITLRAARARWSTVLITAVLLRVMFHVYYGPTAYPGHLLWALALALLYIGTGRIWPLFLAHLTNNGIAATHAVLHQYRPQAAHHLEQGTTIAQIPVISVGLLLSTLIVSALAATRQQASPPA